MRSVGELSLRGSDQKALQAERLAAMAAAKHERALTLASIIGRAASHQLIWHTDETAENYLARVGVDLTKI